MRNFAQIYLSPSGLLFQVHGSYSSQTPCILLTPPAAGIFFTPLFSGAGVGGACGSQIQGGPGSVRLQFGWNGQSGSGFPVRKVPVGKVVILYRCISRVWQKRAVRFLLQFVKYGSEGSGSSLGSWKTVPKAPGPDPSILQLRKGLPAAVLFPHHRSSQG